MFHYDNYRDERNNEIEVANQRHGKKQEIVGGKII